MTVLGAEDKKFAYAFLADREAYHSHKENSAYAVFLVEASLFGALHTASTAAAMLSNLEGLNIVFFYYFYFDYLGASAWPNTLAVTP